MEGKEENHNFSTLSLTPSAVVVGEEGNFCGLTVAPPPPAEAHKETGRPTKYGPGRKTDQWKFSLTNPRIPALLKISSEKHTVNHLKNDIKHLNTRFSQLQSLLEEKESQLCRSRSICGNNGELCSTTPETFPKESTITSNEAHSSSTHLSGRKSLNKDIHLPEAQCASPSKSSYGGYGDDKNGFVGKKLWHFFIFHLEILEKTYDLLETFLGHTNPISCCRFSTSGDNIASASVDGTVRWKVLDFAELKRSSISFFDVDKHETGTSLWARARTKAAKVGKRLSQNSKARKLALQHWLEAMSATFLTQQLSNPKFLLTLPSLPSLSSHSSDLQWLHIHPSVSSDPA
ncbi:hypothetical protein L2E82_40403 [Cichorium intybus]|uniref:Uncharacterized protein n=1 Tax=Cichorium intybus TaxID=13427 RepID=A0ACB9AKX1_CICIN|nr:hypothetical protein L2E82_40403 [Cichorium intybus]